MTIKISSAWNLELILVLAILFFKIVIPNPSLVSILYYATFALEVFLAILLAKNAGKVYLSLFLLVIGVPFIVILPSLSNKGFGLIFQFFYLASSAIFVFICHKMRVDLYVERISFLVAVSAGVIFAFQYFFMPKNYMVHSLLLGFKNPNETGIWIAGTILLLVSSGRYFMRNAIQRVFQIGLVSLLLYLLFLTQCRSALLGILLFLAGQLFLGSLKKGNSSNSMHRIALTCICLLPAIVMIGYFIINSTSLANGLEFITDKGKTLSSRMGVWTESINSISAHPLMGNYSRYSNAGFQAHNAYLHIALFYGIPVLLVLIATLWLVMYRDKRTRGNMLFYSTAIALMLISSFEAFIVSGNTGVAVFYFGALMLALDRGKIPNAGEKREV